MGRRRFALALAVSLLLHLAVAVSPGWRLPEEGEPEMTLEARLAPPPAPKARAASAPQRKKAPVRPHPRHPKPATPRLPQARLPSAESVAAVEPPEPNQGTAPEVPAPEAPEQPCRGEGCVGSAPTPPPTPPEPAAETDKFEVGLPGQGRIRFAVFYGTRGLMVGQSIHTWRQDGSTYAIRNVAETVGLASLFHRAKVVQESRGELSERGFVPEEYSLARDDSGRPSEAARFDWKARRVTLVRDGRQTDTELLDGTEDILSMVYQLVLFPPKETHMEIPVVTGKSYRPQFFEVVGEERVAIRLGDFRALHVRVGTAGEATTELWLALDYKNLPLRIRFTDPRKGEVYEQVATDIEFEDIKLTEPTQLP